jgi:hypothetical protein
MKKMLLVLSFAIVLPFATLAHADSVIGGSNANAIGGTESNAIGGTEAVSASWVSVLWQSLVAAIGGTE